MAELTAQVPPDTITPEPAGVIADGVAVAEPVFVTVTVNDVAEPTVAEEKAPELNVSGPLTVAVPVSVTLFDALTPPG
jgi:hypothetical protein